MTQYNITNLMKQCAIVGVLAVAQTFIIITGGIDISCGAIAGLSCMVLAILQRDTQLGLPITMLAAILVGIVSGLDPRILALGNATFLGIFLVLAIVWVIVAIVILLLLRYTIFGRNLYILGSGENVAKLSGINVRKVYISTYTLTGLLYGIAGILLAARVQSALPTGGEGYEMNAIAVAVIGSASLAGGRGSMTGTLSGTILMILINNEGVQFGLNTHILEITSGVIILLAVAFDMFRNTRAARQK